MCDIDMGYLITGLLEGAKIVWIAYEATQLFVFGEEGFKAALFYIWSDITFNQMICDMKKVSYQPTLQLLTTF